MGTVLLKIIMLIFRQWFFLNNSKCRFCHQGLSDVRGEGNASEKREGSEQRY